MPEDGPYLPEWAPSVERVAAIIRARTKTDESQGGGEAGTFNEDTRPTANQVTELISDSCTEIITAIGRETPCNEDLVRSATSAAAHQAALLIEQSYWPEQTRSDRSSFERLLKLQEKRMDRLVEAVAEQCGGPTSGGNGSGSGSSMPSFNFPDDEIIGRATEL